MIRPTIERELLEQLAVLPAEKQRQVLDYARSLSGMPLRGAPGAELLAFSGTISRDDAEQMMRAIDDGCERIDINEW
jgi:hypothetical protein